MKPITITILITVLLFISLVSVFYVLAFLMGKNVEDDYTYIDYDYDAEIIGMSNFWFRILPLDGAWLVYAWLYYNGAYVIVAIFKVARVGLFE